MPEITLEHIRKAAEWAKTAIEECPLDGQVRKYNQSSWDCGTSCCVWGAASILAGEGPAKSGPPNSWAKDAKSKIIIALLNSTRSTPDQMLLILNRDNLSDANLADANLAGAKIWLGNRRVKLA